MIARVLIDRLLSEPVRGSETAAAIIALLADGDGFHHRNIVSDASFEIMQSLPADEREHIEDHLEAIADRGDDHALDLSG